MEREFGVELARAFGARMKRLYGLDEATLPASIAERLARLERAERMVLAAAPENDDPCSRTRG